MQTRSEKYQYKYAEVSVSYEFICSFIDNNIKYSEEYYEKLDELYSRVLYIMNNLLTEHQRTVLKLHYIDQLTQCEIAKKLGITQSSVTKNIIGNTNKNYENKHGGSIKKLKKICMSDEIILDLLEELKEINAQR